MTRRFWRTLLMVASMALCSPQTNAQSRVQKTSAPVSRSGSYERTFPQPKNEVEKALRELKASLSGRLPALEGFAVEGEHPLNKYQRAFYQSEVQVSSTAAGATLVRVSTKLTAWYPDAAPARSGYQLLKSNGRLESDLLDELTEQMAAARPGTANPAGVTSSDRSPAEKRPAETTAGNAALPTPMPKQTSSLPPVGSGLSSADLARSQAAQKSGSEPAGLAAEAASLEGVLKSQAHPKNLVAVRKSGTPVVATPSLTAKTLFLASEQDEFEMLDFNQDWVHVRISGLSRGWIWRTSLEMPQGISDVPLVGTSTGTLSGAPGGKTSAPVVADLFQVTREETAPFPGDWAPLRGKNVKIISVQKIQDNEENSGAQSKLEFAKSLIDKNYAEISQPAKISDKDDKDKDMAGIVVIFDSVDGGMIAATLGTVQKWKAGAITDAALWHQCYFDPPETFTVSTAAESGAAHGH